MALDIRSELEEFDDAAAGVEASESTGLLPDGKYQVEIEGPASDEGYIYETKNGAKICGVNLEIIGAADDALIGRSLRKTYVLVTTAGVLNETGVSILKGDLEMMDMPLPKLSLIDEVLAATVGARVNITLKTEEDGEYTNFNIYFNDVIEPPSGSTSF